MNLLKYILFTVKAAYSYFLIRNDWNRLTQNPDRLIVYVKQAIKDASLNRSKLLFPFGRKILLLEGMSSEKNRHLLNNICSLRNITYLEIGTWKGSTFISSNYLNKIKSYAMDDWSLFNGPENIFKENCQKYIKQNNYTFFNTNAFQFDKSIIPEKINVFFYDGSHTYDSQYTAFVYYNGLFSDVFICIVDDFNMNDAQKGTFDAFKKLNYTVLYENHLPARYNGDCQQWWNGFYIAVIKKNDLFHEEVND